MLTVYFQTSWHKRGFEFLGSLVNVKENINYVIQMEKWRFHIKSKIYIVLSIVAIQINRPKKNFVQG